MGLPIKSSDLASCQEDVLARSKSQVQVSSWPSRLSTDWPEPCLTLSLQFWQTVSCLTVPNVPNIPGEVQEALLEVMAED